MPIKFQSDPQGGQANVPASFAQLAPAASEFGLDFVPSEAVKLDSSRPLEVYTVDLNDLADGKLLSAARRIAWRYFLLNANGTIVGEAEYNPGEGGIHAATLKPRSVNRGPFAEATEITLRAAEHYVQFQQEVYQPRFLRITAVYFAALWLRAERSNLIFPIGKPPAGLEADKPYFEEQVIEVLQPIAKRNKDFHG
jgi:hypothetical protein